jgi:transcriptional regulator with XRE-family HTH domain
MAKSRLFGDFFKSKRLALGKSLREFCTENNLDAGNISKLERGLFSPTTNSEILSKYAGFLGIKIGSDDWFELCDLAHASAGRIPDEICGNETLLAKLPVVFRTLRGQKLSEEHLDLLADKLKNV